MKKTDSKLILAMETGIDGGSVAILDGNKTICSAEGKGKVSKSEDLLLLIEDILKGNGLKKEQIEVIAVSDLPGSLTGLRIGLATARGLADSFGAKVYKASILEAQLIVATAKGRTISALYSEKNGIFYQIFDLQDTNFKPVTDVVNERNFDHFVNFINKENSPMVLDRNLSAVLSRIDILKDFFNKNDIKVAEGSLAESLGSAGAAHASDNE